MEPWPFVIAAYVLTLGGTVATSIWAWRSAKNAESRAEQMQERD